MDFNSTDRLTGGKRMVATLACALSALMASPSHATSNMLESPGDFGDCKLVVRPGMPPLVLATRNALLVSKDFLSHDAFHEYQPSVSANWLATRAEESDGSILAIVASFKDRRVRVYQLPQSGAPQLISVLAESDDTLRIDPTLLRVEDTYYATVTEVSGKANNPDPMGPNGRYEIVLFSSKDARTWKRVSSIHRDQRNLEDGSLLYDSARGILWMIFESETYDMGPSRLLASRSSDLGRSWSAPFVLIADGADNEVATCRVDDDALTVYFSSDRHHLGGTYEQSEMFVAEVRLPELELRSVRKIGEAGVGIALLSCQLASSNRLQILGLRTCLSANKLSEIEVVP